MFLALCFWFFYFKVAYTPYGSIRADWVELSPRIDGYIDQIKVKTDMHVDKDHHVMAIFSYPFELKVRQTSADLATNKAELSQLQVMSEDLKAEIEIQGKHRELMAIKRDRNESLSKKDAISVEKYQDILMDYEISSLNLAELNLKKNSTERQIEIKKSQIESTAAQLAIDEYNLSQTKINAPFSGYITNNYVMPGQYCKTGQPLCGIRGDVCWAEMNYKENYIGRIRPGMKAYLQTDIYPTRIFSGTVESIISAVNRNQQQNLTLPYVEPTIDWVRLQYRFTVRVRFDNLPEDVRLMMGANVRCLIPLNQPSIKTEHPVK
ncbi:MAG: hypothetical protein A2X45_11660 [Lentisphaerae bacterium GWF2_50_93]|nr:MAG: hypothetical protein A2X45_11660 [Lentisphaerae bacterium GWF2_50_93]